MAKMLYVAKGGARKTEIMYRANLSHTQIDEYLDDLLINSLIEQTIVNGKTGYVATGKGRVFIRLHNELSRMIEHSSGIRKKPRTQKKLSSAQSLEAAQKGS